MKRENIIRAWKDAAYRSSLSETERANLPEHPAGLIELVGSDLGAAAGGARNTNPSTVWACTLPTMVCYRYTC